MAGLVDGERAGPDQVRDDERVLQTQEREGLAEVRDSEAPAPDRGQGALLLFVFMY